MKPYKITVDVKNLSNYMTKKVEAKQNDTNSRTVQATICDDGIPLNLTGNTISFYAKKPDKTKIFNTVNILDDENGLVEFNLTTQTLAVEGEVKCELTIFDEAEGVILSTAIFNISVIETIRDDNAIESSNEFNQIIQVLNRLSEIEAYEMERISNEEARILAEQQREQNDSERITNENTRQQSENTRKDNEITRKQNETQRKSNEDTRKQNETIRENNEYVREDNESQRKVSENTRSQNENDRISNEDSRITNENQRVTDENTRKQNEDDRVSNENARKQSEAVREEEEAQRKTYESRRRQDEQIRHQNETARKENESKRELSEAERISNEEARIQNEIDRQDFNPSNYVKTVEKGEANGVAPLDGNRLISEQYLPSGLEIESGTWTPEIGYATTWGTVDLEYFKQIGVYTKIGNLVVCTFSLRLNSDPPEDPNFKALAIVNLPFSSLSEYESTFAPISGLFFGTTPPLGAYVQLNGNKLELYRAEHYDDTLGLGSVGSSSLRNGSWFSGTIIYAI